MKLELEIILNRNGWINDNWFPKLLNMRIQNFTSFVQVVLALNKEKKTPAQHSEGPYCHAEKF